MAAQNSPFVEATYGWPYGSNGWDGDMNTNLVKFSYLHDRNIDAIVSSLPAIVNGKAYFNTADNRLYFDANGQRYSSVTPKWFEVTLRATGEVYQFDGTVLAVKPDPLQYTDALKEDLAENTAGVGTDLIGTVKKQPTTVERSLSQKLDDLPIFVEDYFIAGETDAALPLNRIAAYFRTLPTGTHRPKVTWTGRIYVKTPVDFGTTNLKEFGGTFSPAGLTVADRQNGSSVIDLTQYTAGPGTVALTFPEGFNGGSFLVQGSGDRTKDPIGVYCPNMLPCDISKISFRDLHNWNFLAERCSDPRFTQIRASNGGAAINRKDTVGTTFTATTSSTTVTASTSIFAAGDVGKEFVMGTDAAGAHASIIATYISPTQVTIVDTVPSAITSKPGCFGLIQCSTTSGSPTVVFERSWLSAADVGRHILLDGAGATRTPMWVKIINQAGDGITCTISENAATTSSTVQMWIATIGILPNKNDYPNSPGLAPNGWTVEDCVVENSNGPAWAIYARSAEMIGNNKAYVDQGKCASGVLVWNATYANLKYNNTGAGRRHTKVVGTSNRCTIDLRSGNMPTGDYRPLLIDANSSTNEIYVIAPGDIKATTLFEITAAADSSGFKSSSIKIKYQPLADNIAGRNFWRLSDFSSHKRSITPFTAATGAVIDTLAPNLIFLNTPLDPTASGLSTGIYYHLVRIVMTTAQWNAQTLANHYTLTLDFTASTDVVLEMYPSSGSFVEEPSAGGIKSVYALINTTKYGRCFYTLTAVGVPAAITNALVETIYMFD